MPGSHAMPWTWVSSHWKHVTEGRKRSLLRGKSGSSYKWGVSVCQVVKERLFSVTLKYELVELQRGKAPPNLSPTYCSSQGDSGVAEAMGGTHTVKSPECVAPVPPWRYFLRKLISAFVCHLHLSVRRLCFSGLSAAKPEWPVVSLHAVFWSGPQRPCFLSSS